MRYTPFDDQEEEFGHGDEWAEEGSNDLLSAAYDAQQASYEGVDLGINDYIVRTIHHYYPAFAGKIHHISGEAFRLTGRVRCDLMASYEVIHTFEGVRGGKYRAQYQRVQEEGEWVWVRLR